MSKVLRLFLLVCTTERNPFERGLMRLLILERHTSVAESGNSKRCKRLNCDHVNRKTSDKCGAMLMTKS